MNTTSVLQYSNINRVNWIRERFSQCGFLAGGLLSLVKPYIEGLDHIPSDGRVLFVGNHTLGGVDVPLITYVAGSHLGRQLYGLVHKQLGGFSQKNGLLADLSAASGAVLGTPENASQLMEAGEAILVFPGGGRDITRGKDELNQIVWGDRKGFARLAVQHNYPIVPVTLVGADYLYRVLTTRNGLWGRVAAPVVERVTGISDGVPAIMAGVGLTPVPFPQRLYLRFSPPIDTTNPEGLETDSWIEQVRDTAKEAIENSISDLLAVRHADPFRHLAPWARGEAAVPPRAS